MWPEPDVDEGWKEKEFDEIQKAISALSGRIDNFGSEEGITLQKSGVVPTTDIVVPSTPDMANMSWDEVHQLAGTVFRGE